ncbi:hypothetical protein [Bacillus sp. SM2101]|uniref:hypothetical protein n=1 Tax=Bacillus sp. SM2101 TaxID=2805366 RepID=UPI001BDF60D8|nr:hypothetical protein [Bacillus sp. SM2101]
MKGAFETTAIVNQGVNTPVAITTTTVAKGKKAIACAETKVTCQMLYEIVEICVNSLSTVSSCTDFSIGDTVCIPCKNDGCPNDQVVAECNECAMFLQLIEDTCQPCPEGAKRLPPECSCRTVKFEIFGDEAPWVLVSPPVLCPGQKFNYELYTKMTLDSQFGSSGFIALDALEGNLMSNNAEVSIENINSSTLPPGTFLTFIVPDGQQIFAVFDDYFFEIENFDPQRIRSLNFCPTLVFNSWVKKGAMIGEVVIFGIEAFGFVNIANGTTAFINGLTFNGPLIDNYRVDISIQTTIVSPDDLCCK